MITVVLLAIVIVLFTISIVWRGNPKKLPPGPRPWPFFGNMHLLRQLSRKYGGQHFAFLELSQQYCSNLVSLYLGSEYVVAVSGSEEINTILHNSEYDGRPWNEFVKLRNMGVKKGITMADGPEWKEMRAWTIRSLRTLGFGRKEMSELVKDELIRVLDNLKEGGIFRMKPLISPAVINVLWMMLTGKRLGDGPKLQYFVELMERRSKAFNMAGGLLSTFPWFRYIIPGSSGYNLLVTLNNEIKAFLMETIEDHKKHYVEGSDNDLIDMFLHEMYSGKGDAGGYTEEQLILILLDLFIAGINTTAATLDFVFLNITVHNDKQQQLHQEIDNVVGYDRLPSLNDRPKMPYAEAVLVESQRMFVVTPIIGPRRVLRETKLGNYTLPTETTILINIYSVNMNPKFYPNPHDFVPERFIKNNTYEADENMVLFGNGKRRCPGEVLAKTALFLLFTGIMQKYEILPVPGKEIPSLIPDPGLTISAKPYEVLVVPRRRVSNGKVSGSN